MTERLARNIGYVAVGVVLGIVLCSLLGKFRDAKAILAQPQARFQNEGSWTSPPQVRLRPAFVPHYVRCLLKPKLWRDGSLTTCAALRQSLDTWTATAASIDIDTSECGAFLGGHAAEAARLARRTIVLRPGSTDHKVFLQIYCEQNFDFLEPLLSYLPPDRGIAILDAGANIGLASILFEQATLFGSAVLAVDALPASCDVLRENVGAGSAIVPLNAAIVAQDVADAHPTITVSGPKDQFWGFKVEHEPKEYSNRVATQVATASLLQLKSHVPSKHFDWIKMDIEGEERKLLVDPASREVLCEATCLFMELHEWLVPGCKPAFDDFMAWGCPGSGPFHKVAETGEYMLLCKAKAAVDHSRLRRS